MKTIFNILLLLMYLNQANALEVKDDCNVDEYSDREFLDVMIKARENLNVILMQSEEEAEKLNFDDYELGYGEELICYYEKSKKIEDQFLRQQFNDKFMNLDNGCLLFISSADFDFLDENIEQYNHCINDVNKTISSCNFIYGGSTLMDAKEAKSNIEGCIANFQ